MAKPRPRVLALLAQYPEGGPGLRNAVARALRADPDLAQDVAAASHEANLRQRRAIGAGLADALDYFRRQNSATASEAQKKIERARSCCDPETIAAMNSQLQNTLQAIPGFNANTTNSGAGGSTDSGGGTIVSPSRP